MPEADDSLLEPAPAWPGVYRPTVAEADAYERMIGRLRGFLDDLAAAKLDPETLQALTRDLTAWSGRLSEQAVDEDQRMFGRLGSRFGRGQTMSAPIAEVEAPAGEFRGTVRFGEYFSGPGRAVTGVAVPGVVDEVLARAAIGPGGARARTAYLHVNFRALTPVGVDLDVHSWIEREEGRKVYIRGEISHGEVVCVDGEALLIRLRPEQG
jgi:hypothetical protein